VKKGKEEKYKKKIADRCGEQLWKKYKRRHSTSCLYKILFTITNMFVI
jgi:hypothetical protein